MRGENNGSNQSAKYVQMKENPLDTVNEIFTKLKNVHLSPIAEASIGVFVAILRLSKKFGVTKKWLLKFSLVQT